MDYTFIIIGFVGGAILVLLITMLIFRKEKVSGYKQPENLYSLISEDGIRTKVKALLASGKKIEAIKFMVKQKNIGLAEGKKLVDFIEKLNLNTADVSVFKNMTTEKNISAGDPELLNQVRKLIVDGNKIQAIKLVVTNRKMGLKEAKDFVEKLETKYKQ